jgi:hypothetical protein
MYEFPFYHDKQEGRDDVSDMSALEKKQRDQDWEDAKYMIEYRRNSGWDAKAVRGMKIYNVLQTAKADDEVSRIFLGYTRTQIDKGVEQMTEGEPDFDFEPYGPSDSKKTVIWKHLLRKVLSDSNYKVHQELFFRDYFVMGSAVFEVYIDYPQRTQRVPNQNVEGGFEEVIVRDYRRPKVGIRALNPLACWRNPNIDDPTKVPSCLKKRIITWNQFAQDYGRAKLPDGTPKYKNLGKIAKGSHVCIWTYQDEIRDILRDYAVSFGNESDGMAKSPAMDDFGVQIYDKSLKIHEVEVNGVIERCEGLNVQGMCNLRWGTYFDKYDLNYNGQHQVYGMGLPERIEGEDMILQTIFNIQIDNYRWQNAVALNYEGNNADSYIDVDANQLVGGELIDGKITPMPLGIYRPNDFGSMKEVLDGSVIPATGINHQQIVGDTSKTAFEFAQRIKMASSSAEQRLARLENEVFKPIGGLLLSGALTELTVEEWEDMTESQADAAREAIKNKQATKEDYDFSKNQRKVKNYVKVKGAKIREDFTQGNKRKLDYNSTDNTLIYDSKMEEKDSYVPMVKEYVYPLEYAETGVLPDCIVDSKRMIKDMKAQRVQDFQSAMAFLMQLRQLGWAGMDDDKAASMILEFGEIAPSKILNDAEQGSDTDLRKKALDEMSRVMYGTAAPQPQMPGVMPGQPQKPAQNPLEATAQGTL